MDTGLIDVIIRGAIGGAFLGLLYGLYSFASKLFNSKNITKPMETKSMEKLEPIHNNNSLTKDMENTSEERLEEERLYEFVMKEFKSGERREGLWTKAMVQVSGDEKQIELEYIKLRVQSLIDEKEQFEKEEKEIEDRKKLQLEKDKFQVRKDILKTFFKKVFKILMWCIIGYFFVGIISTIIILILDFFGFIEYW